MEGFPDDCHRDAVDRERGDGGEEDKTKENTNKKIDVEPEPGVRRKQSWKPAVIGTVSKSLAVSLPEGLTLHRESLATSAQSPGTCDQGPISSGINKLILVLHVQDPALCKSTGPPLSSKPQCVTLASSWHKS